MRRFRIGFVLACCSAVFAAKKDAGGQSAGTSTGKRISMYWPFSPGEEWMVTHSYGPEHWHNPEWAHYALDLQHVGGSAATKGKTVRAAASGTVHSVGSHGSYGTRVMIDHGNGIGTLYAHLDETSVQPGARVGALDPIGKAGNSGTRANHIHFEVRDISKGWEVNGKPVTRNPELFLGSGEIGLVHPENAKMIEPWMRKEHREEVIRRVSKNIAEVFSPPGQEQSRTLPPPPVVPQDSRYDPDTAVNSTAEEQPPPPYVPPQDRFRRALTPREGNPYDMRNLLKPFIPDAQAADGGDTPGKPDLERLSVDLAETTAARVGPLRFRVPNSWSVGRDDGHGKIFGPGGVFTWNRFVNVTRHPGWPTVPYTPAGISRDIVRYTFAAVGAPYASGTIAVGRGAQAGAWAGSQDNGTVYEHALFWAGDSVYMVSTGYPPGDAEIPAGFRTILKTLESR